MDAAEVGAAQVGAAQVEVEAPLVGVGLVKVICLLQQRDLQGARKGTTKKFQEQVNLDQLPLGRQQNGLGELLQRRIG